MRETVEFGKGKPGPECKKTDDACGVCGQPASGFVSITLRPRRHEAQADARALRRLIRAAARACGFRARVEPRLPPRRRRRRGAAALEGEQAGS